MTEKVGGIEFDVTVNSDGAISASKKIVTSNESVENSFQDIDHASRKAGDNMTDALNKGAKASGNFSRNIGMGAVQVGQFAGQIQGGQSALLAFSQQGADIGMLFGPTGMVIGGIIAVGSAVATLLVPSLMDAGDETEDLTEKLKELRKTSELTAEESAFLAMQEAKEREEREKKIKVLDQQIKEMEEAAKGTSMLANLTVAARNATSGMTKEIAQRLLPSLREQREELFKSRAELVQLKRAQGEITTPAAFDAEANKEAIRGYAKRIAAIQTAMEQESAIVVNQLKYRKGVEDGIFSEQEAAIMQRNENQIANEKAAFANKMAMLGEQRTAILEDTALTEQQRQELLGSLRAQETDAEWTHQQKLTEIDAKATEARMKLAEKEKRAKLSVLSSMFGNISSLMNTESRKMFEIGKAAAIAGAIVDGIAAVQGAYKTGSKIGGPPLGAAYAATAAIATLANIKQIQSTNFGSKSAGQSYQGGQVSNNVNSVQQEPQRQIVDVRVTGKGGGVVDMFNFEVQNGAQPIVTGG